MLPSHMNLSKLITHLNIIKTKDIWSPYYSLIIPKYQNQILKNPYFDYEGEDH
jgi:hypothetical protein